MFILRLMYMTFIGWNFLLLTIAISKYRCFTMKVSKQFVSNTIFLLDFQMWHHSFFSWQITQRTFLSYLISYKSFPSFQEFYENKHCCTWTLRNRVNFQPLIWHSLSTIEYMAFNQAMTNLNQWKATLQPLSTNERQPLINKNRAYNHYQPNQTYRHIAFKL